MEQHKPVELCKAFVTIKKIHAEYSKAWNSQLPDESVKTIDFQRDAIMLEEISDPIAIERDWDNIPEETQYSHIYLNVIEQSESDRKIVELENWKSKGVYTKVEKNNQTFIFNPMGHTEKLMEGKQIIKARLFAKVFQEIQDFRTDSPCYSII